MKEKIAEWLLRNHWAMFLIALIVVAPILYGGYMLYWKVIAPFEIGIVRENLWP